MSEFLSLRDRLLAASAAGILAIGCIEVIGSEPEVDKHLVRCEKNAIPFWRSPPPPRPEKPESPSPIEYRNIHAFSVALKSYRVETKQRQQQIDSYNKLTQLPPLRLHTDKRGNLEGDPFKPSKDLKARILKAIVRIETQDGGVGSGFLMTDDAGERVAITAAHVIGDNKLEKMKIIDTSGHSARPTSGCYYFEEQGRFRNLARSELSYHRQNKDLAVLRLSNSLGQSALRFSKTVPQRSEWGFFFNYQAVPPVDKPKIYSSLVLAGPPAHDLTLLTGTHSWGAAGNDEKRLNQIMSHLVTWGASGGAVVNQTGEVIGMSIAASLYYENDETLMKTWNTVLPDAQFGEQFGFTPVVAYLASMDLIQRGLAAISESKGE